MGDLCNVDTVWTHTDTVVIDEDGRVTESKALSTPDDFSKGFFDSFEGPATESQENKYIRGTYIGLT
ncbi:hydantoinase/oxoprolinase N-terminal domain-containing protein [Natrinema sp. 1APR25-10V2]|uniref:hydantoinase/oxoprolinase N-terminal domain-containing protein n=1 Tax=Natrinema sp. 1APR25-10V2 TaxID=2951081 RepID=UPI002874A921|nr:hydantoinase/oxoprolinase N-terminal domain-containing protein [Natrinema sp. 1APR25-10V2]MDS0476978.1 hypothetical protein [Natrinema sp. 1APR25-10V2]